MKLAFWRRNPPQEKALQAPDDNRHWTRIFDWTPGAWQTDAAYQSSESVLSNPALFACASLISSDIAKLRPTLQQKQGAIWQEASRDPFPVLSKPNAYQNHIRFKQQWVESKLIHGNTYVLKVRSNNRIQALQVLDPLKVTALISESGEVFYRLGRHRLTGNADSELTVPAREIIHDRWNCLYHPLIGLPPIFAGAAMARTGNEILDNSRAFFANGSNPSGILSAPGSISESTATRLKEYFEANFTGTKSGKVAVAGDGLKYEPLRMTSIDAQVVEQLRLSAETVVSTFHVPGYMVGVGPQPTHNNIEALNVQYYSQCLQVLIEDMEAALDEGLRIPAGQRVQLDLDGLFRMDQSSHVESLARAVGAGILSPNEARSRLNYGPVAGGDSPYLQRNRSLSGDLIN